MIRVDEGEYEDDEEEYDDEEAAGRRNRVAPVSYAARWRGVSVWPRSLPTLWGVNRRCAFSGKRMDDGEEVVQYSASGRLLPPTMYCFPAPAPRVPQRMMCCSPAPAPCARAISTLRSVVEWPQYR